MLASAVPPPGDILHISCSNCDNVAQIGSNFHVSAGTKITLSANLDGRWVVSADNSTELTTTINQKSDFVFNAFDGQQDTAHVYVDQISYILPQFESDVIIDDDRSWFAAGDTFKVKVDLENIDCQDYQDCRYQLKWTTDDSKTLRIDDDTNQEATITVLGSPDNGRNPEITVTISNPGGSDHKSKKIVIQSLEPPVIELTVTANVYKQESQIVASDSGSYTPSDNNKIEYFYATLYRVDGGSREQVDQPQKVEGDKITFTVGQGYYEVVAHVEDEHGTLSQEETKTVTVAPNEDEIPQVSVTNKYVTCVNGTTCDIYASVSGQNANIGYYDENGSPYVCNGFDCPVEFPKPGNRVVTVWGYHYDDPKYSDSDRHSVDYIYVNVTQKNASRPIPTLQAIVRNTTQPLPANNTETNWVSWFINGVKWLWG